MVVTNLITYKRVQFSKYKDFDAMRIIPEQKLARGIKIKEVIIINLMVRSLFKV